MRWLFTPGARMMLRLSNEKKLPLISLLFLLPLALLYWETGDRVSAALGFWLMGAVALAL